MAPAMHRCLRAAAIAAALAPALGLEAWLKDGGSDPPCALQPSLLETQISAAPPKDASEAVVTKPEVVSEIIGDGKQALEAWNKCNWAKKVIDLAWENSGDWMKPASDHLSETIPDDNGDPDMPEHLWLHQATPVDVPAKHNMCFWESMHARLTALGFELPNDDGPVTLRKLVALAMMEISGWKEKGVPETLNLHVLGNSDDPLKPLSVEERAQTLYTGNGDFRGSNIEAFVISQYFRVRVVVYSPDAEKPGKLSRKDYFLPSDLEVLGTIWLLHGDWQTHDPHWDGLVPDGKVPPKATGVSEFNGNLANTLDALPTSYEELFKSFSEKKGDGIIAEDQRIHFIAEDQNFEKMVGQLHDRMGCSKEDAENAVALSAGLADGGTADFGQALLLLDTVQKLQSNDRWSEEKAWQAVTDIVQDYEMVPAYEQVGIFLGY